MSIPDIEQGLLNSGYNKENGGAEIAFYPLASYSRKILKSVPSFIEYTVDILNVMLF